MLEAISWKHYIIAVLCFTFIWYVAVILLFYRKQLRDFIYRSGKGKAGSQNTAEDLSENYDDSFEELEDMVNKIRHSILLKAGKKASKDELLEQLSALLASYSGLRRPAYRIALNNYIIQNAESLCGVLFSEQELEEAWQQLEE